MIVGKKWLSTSSWPSSSRSRSTLPIRIEHGNVPPPHDFFGHTIGAYCPSMMEVFMAKSKAERGRFSSRKKMEVVLRVLRGDDLDLVSREAGITAATVSAWRD
jgi:hypothetical protein